MDNIAIVTLTRKEIALLLRALPEANAIGNFPEHIKQLRKRLEGALKELAP